MIKSVYGMNIAVRDLESARNTYEEFFGLKSEFIAPDTFALPGLVGARFHIGGFVLNLISYSDEKTSVAKFLNTRGEGVFLLSLLVDDIDEDVSAVRKKGLDLVFPETAKGDFGAANFIHPKSMHGVLIELYQPKST